MRIIGSRDAWSQGPPRMIVTAVLLWYFVLLCLHVVRSTTYPTRMYTYTWDKYTYPQLLLVSVTQNAQKTPITPPTQTTLSACYSAAEGCTTAHRVLLQQGFTVVENRKGKPTRASENSLSMCVFHAMWVWCTMLFPPHIRGSYRLKRAFGH